MIPQTDRLSFKMLRVDKAALRQCALAQGETMSVIVRRILRDGLKRRGFWPPNDDRQRQTREADRDEC